MAGNDEEKVAPEMEQAPADPWAVAFAALDEEDQKDAEATPDTGGEPGGDLPDAAGDDGSEDSAAPEAGDGGESEDGVGGPGDLGGEDGGAHAYPDTHDIDITQEQVDEYRKTFVNDLRERAISDVARAYIKQGARNSNGKLGATITDPDVCKRDSDGVPRFYNPETGREFTGDNPRRQAQEWVDDYNRELADAFNKTCDSYYNKLMETEGSKLAVIEFAPTFRKLDPMRRSMLESIIEDYELKDKDGDVIGYSCDLNKALAAVNRQVRAIQRSYKASQPSTPPSGPVLDTPSTQPAQKSGSKPQFKSIEEAMEWEQDQLLEKMRGKRGGH